eukprot:SAG11_NODE_266_length_11468_cov_11.519222_5_plen_89_part_00
MPLLLLLQLDTQVLNFWTHQALRLQGMVEERLQRGEAVTKGLAIEVSEVREQIDCLGFKRYGGAWSNVTGRASTMRVVAKGGALSSGC